MRFFAVAVLAVAAGCAGGEMLYTAPEDSGADSGWTDASADAANDAAPDVLDLPDAEPDAELPDAGPDVVEPPPCEVFAWPDADGDGFGDETVEPVEACEVLPEGHVTNGDDCYDDNADAKPGATTWSTVDRGDGSYDYNCDGDQEKNWPDMQICADPDADPPVDGFRGWALICLMNVGGTCQSWSSVPECGMAGKWRTNGDCTGQAFTVTQRCR